MQSGDVSTEVRYTILKIRYILHTFDIKEIVMCCNLTIGNGCKL